jgi:hypothetical protein
MNLQVLRTRTFLDQLHNFKIVMKDCTMELVNPGWFSSSKTLADYYRKSVRPITTTCNPRAFYALFAWSDPITDVCACVHAYVFVFNYDICLWTLIFMPVTFIYVVASRPTLGPTQPPSHWVPRYFCPGIECPGREADHSSLFSSEVKNV